MSSPSSSPPPIPSHQARRDFVVKTLAQELRGELEAALKANTADAYSREGPARAERTLKNACLPLSHLEDPEVDAGALRRFDSADNMTDQVAALAALTSRTPERVEALEKFYEQWNTIRSS